MKSHRHLVDETGVGGKLVIMQMTFDPMLYVVEHDGLYFSIEQLQRRGQLQFLINDQSYRVGTRPQSCGQCRVVEKGGTRSHENRGLFGPPFVHETVRDIVRNTKSSAIACDESVGSLRPFQHDIGTVLQMEGEEAFVELDAFFFQYTHLHIYTGRAQTFDAFTVHFRKRVAAADDDPGDPHSDDQVRAGRRLSMMCAGFE